MEVLVADVEGNDLLPGLTTMWCLGIGDPKTGEVEMYANHKDYKPLAEGLARLHQADRVVFHNGLGYDFEAIEKLYPGTLRWEQIWDTLVVGRMLRPDIKDQRLANWGRIFKFPKGDHTDFSRFSHEMAKYCRRDVEITMQLYRMLQSMLKKDLKKEGIDWRPAIHVEHQVAYVIIEQERHGFRLDVEAAQALESELRVEKMEILDELREIFPPVMRPEKGTWDWFNRKWKGVEVTTPKVNNGPRGITKGAPYCKVVVEEFNPKSGQQKTFRLTKKYGWKPEKLTEAGAPCTDEEVLSELDYVEAKAMLRYDRITKQLGQIADGKNGWLKLEKNGYVHGRVNPVGARTFRMTHFAPNMAQVDKKDKRMRAVWLPDPGHKQVGCDASGLELRMLSHYLARWDGGEYARIVVDDDKANGLDAHSRNRDTVGLYSRDSAKTLMYAFMYGGGDLKLGLIIIEDARDAGKGKPKGNQRKIGKTARTKLETGITGLDQLVGLCKKRTKQKGYLKGLDGRKVISNAQHAALNTLLQSAGAIVMKYALAIFHYELCLERGWVDPVMYRATAFSYLANVHDEVQMSAPPEIAEELGQMFAKAIELAGERLKLKVPLAGEYMVGDNWKETH
jgi:DNA polymerase-1